MFRNPTWAHACLGIIVNHPKNGSGIILRFISTKGPQSMTQIRNLTLSPTKFHPTVSIIPTLSMNSSLRKNIDIMIYPSKEKQTSNFSPPNPPNPPTNQPKPLTLPNTKAPGCPGPAAPSFHSPPDPSTAPPSPRPGASRCPPAAAAAAPHNSWEPGPPVAAGGSLAWDRLWDGPSGLGEWSEWSRFPSMLGISQHPQGRSLPCRALLVEAVEDGRQLLRAHAAEDRDQYLRLHLGIRIPWGWWTSCREPSGLIEGTCQ